MQTEFEWAYYAAATLAIDLIEARPGLHEDVAADIAWQTFKEDEAPAEAKFQAAVYSFEVTRAINEIRSGRRERVEHSPSMLEKALERLRKHIASTARNPDVR